MKIIGIIPARYASTRFPGKPLAEINGKSMIRRVFEQASKATSIDKVIVATDDERIYNHVLNFGGAAVYTSSNHQTGTDRCAEVTEKKEKGYDVVINIQGDEPYINPEQINQVAELFNNANTQLGTLIKILKDENELKSNSIIKVLKNNHNEALYFSRNVIPYLRNFNTSIPLVNQFNYYKHIGIYGYRTDILAEITQLKQSKLELAESLEQLRWIENGYKITLAETIFESHSVDLPEDIKKFDRLN
jgi:3-deoxy-manno-octulosonate cytidylyltransferase (CMP-KDO synthetase)